MTELFVMIALVLSVVVAVVFSRLKQARREIETLTSSARDLGPVAEKVERERRLVESIRKLEDDHKGALSAIAASEGEAKGRATAEARRLEEEVARWRERAVEEQRAHAEQERALAQARANEETRWRALERELRTSVELLEEHNSLQQAGFYRAKYAFRTSQEYKDRREAIREDQKRMLKAEKAVVCSAEWMVAGDRRAGKIMTKNYVKLVERAFNGDCDAAVEKVRSGNVRTIESRIKSSFEKINAIASHHQCSITEAYLQLKLDEMAAAYEYHAKVRDEKEAERERRAQEEDDKAADEELARIIRDAEEREAAAAAELAKLAEKRAKLVAAGADETRIEKIATEMEKAQLKIDNGQAEKADAIEALKTQRGFVYVISNVGSFGDNVYKIGMTRREDPEIRVNELSSASVPYRFDIHAVIETENARALETKLHHVLTHRRVNRVNHHKEFFRADLEEIKRTVLELGATGEFRFISSVEFEQTAAAIEYRQTLAKKSEPPPPRYVHGAAE